MTSFLISPPSCVNSIMPAELVVRRLLAIGGFDLVLPVERADGGTAKLHLGGVLEAFEHRAPIAGANPGVEALDVLSQQSAQLHTSAPP